MSRLPRLLVLALMALALAGCATGGPRPGGSRAGRALLGTWQRIPDDPSGLCQLKTLSPTHFVWTVFDPAHGVPVATGGGTWTFDGTTYTETLEFLSADYPRDLVGPAQTFRADLDGDTWRHTGTLSNGAPIVETWRRR